MIGFQVTVDNVGDAFLGHSNFNLFYSPIYSPTNF